MAKVRAFNGIRYNPAKVKDLAVVISPPYDIISPGEQEEYYERDEHNIIRLEFGKTFPTDDQDDNRYTRAARDFQKWLREGVLVPEPRPAFYVYEQVFEFEGRRRVRRGMFTGFQLEPWYEGSIFPHEATFPKPKSDRLALMRACRANFSPVYSLSSTERPGQLGDVLAELTGASPTVETTDDRGETHRLWVVDAAAQIQRVQQVLDPAKLVIADGHHRYETALTYREERRAEEGPPSEQKPYDSVLMMIVDKDDPGLVILPTHRLLRGLGEDDLARLRGLANRYFDIQAVRSGGDAASSALETVMEKLRRLPQRHVFAAAGLAPDELWLLVPKVGVELDGVMPGDKSAAWRGLDVAIVHELLLDPVLQGKGKNLGPEEGVGYTRDAQFALESVQSGEYQAALFVRPTEVQQIIDVALARDKMPEKSTYFQPKIPTGLVINPLF